MMVEITFHNMAEIRVQAQIYSGRTLVSTCLADPGETHVMEGESLRNDIFLKEGATGRELARQLGTEAKIFTLSLHNGRYVLS